MRSDRSLALLLFSMLALACGGSGTRGGGDGDGGGPADASGDAADTGSPPGDTGAPPVVDAGPETDAGPRGDCDVEICDNGTDDDCDGVVEEGCACLPGETSACFAGPAASRGLGVCADGEMLCMDGLEFGAWGACVGGTLPGTESCEAGGTDEDCDGAVDEGCECVGDEPVPCGSDVGGCSTGTQQCVDGVRTACEGAAGPVAEGCNGIDDDCDGVVDEDVSRACGSDVGECAMGRQVCLDGAWDVCVGGREPEAEMCDNRDNDCDGATDEDLSRGCGSDVGVCTAGTQTCEAGSWSTCGGEVSPSVETCNGMDDDCDGRTDEGVTRNCGSSTGECRPGTETCADGAWGACAGGVGPGTEACDGRRDEDCDGTVDEGCGCTTGDTRACGIDTGRCSAGTQTCDAMGNWAGCVGAVGPVPEECNMADDDCDGLTDEMGICPTSPPVVTCGANVTAEFLRTVSISGSGSDPDGGTVTYSWTVTTRPTGSTANPSPANTANTSLYLDSVGAYVLQLCVTDDEGESACCDVGVTATAPGAITAILSWDTAYGDVDLHMLNVTRTQPDGWWTFDDCHYANRNPDWGPTGANANPSLDVDDKDGYGPEAISIDVNPQSGTYAVGVHFFCSHSLGSGSIAPGDGPSTGTVKILCDGMLVDEITGIDLARTDDWRTVATIDYPSCRVRRVNSSTTGSDLLPATVTSPRHCIINCTRDQDCPGDEVCRTVRLTGGGGIQDVCVFP